MFLPTSLHVVASLAEALQIRPNTRSPLAARGDVVDGD